MLSACGLKEAWRKVEMVFITLRERGLGVNLHYIPIYRHPYCQKNAAALLPLPNAEDYYARAISIPLFATMTDKEDIAVSILGEVLTKLAPGTAQFGMEYVRKRHWQTR